MKTFICRLALFALLVVILSGAAFAQFEDNKKSRLGVRLTTFRPSSSRLSAISGNWIGPTIDYHATFDKQDRPQIVVSLAWLSETADRAKGKMQPFTATYLKHYAKDTDSNGFYTGAGLGIYLLNYEEVGVVSSSLGWVGNSERKIGLHVLAGYELSNMWFAELRYDKVGSVTTPIRNVSFDGLTISIGTRMAY